MAETEGEGVWAFGEGRSGEGRKEMRRGRYMSWRESSLEALGAKGGETQTEMNLLT